MKFRLDEMGDIIWYNDVVYCQQLSSPATAEPNESNGGVFNDLVAILLGCESFDILTGAQPGLLFSTYAGHNIEFKVTDFRSTSGTC